MSHALPSAEVAADFRDALQDLKVNSRPEISNLTIIAKENTEHAQAISRELENHIQTARPEWRLPALYVLDSIVKNVGTPYTVYLGRNLYRTFMDAYTLMDMPTRKAMEGLLKTWKQPVPDSLDTRPVFPVEVTREIENALIKYRTVAIQHQQQQARTQKQIQGPLLTGVSSAIPWRNTPTPPQSASRYSPANDPRVKQSTPQPYQPPYTQPHGAPQAPSYTGNMQDPKAAIDASKLLADVERLVELARTSFAANPYDALTQQKLKALLDLQMILKSQQLAPEQIKLIQDQVMQLSPPSISTPAQTPNPAPPAPPPTAQTHPNMLQNNIGASSTPVPPPVTPLSLSQLLQQSAGTSQPSLASLVGLSLPQIMQQTPTPVQGAAAKPAPPPQPSSTPAPAVPPQPPNLAQLLEQFAPRATPTPQLPVNPPPAPFPSLIPQVTPTPTPAQVPLVGNMSSLLEALRSQQLLPDLRPGTPSTSQSTRIPVPPAVPPNIIGVVPPSMGFGKAPNDVELTTASLKRPRLNLIGSLYEALPNQCSTCGRRFTNTAEGKQMKAKHMDWHFKVKDPDLAKRGVHRSWYISEREWIEFREQDEAAPTPPENGEPVWKGGIVTKKEAKDQYIHVPTDTQLLNAPCPICQEQFRPHWHSEANDFVWMDAVRVNGKIYHATCWEEYSRGASPAAGRVSTPDSVLGKRKAEGIFDNEPSRIKMR